MKILFVGGPKDGRREFFPQNYDGTIRVPVFPPPVDRVVVYDTIDVQTHAYQLKKFQDEHGNEFKVAFYSSVTNPMEALIKGYHYHRKPRYGRSRRIP